MENRAVLWRTPGHSDDGSGATNAGSYQAAKYDRDSLRRKHLAGEFVIGQRPLPLAMLSVEIPGVRRPAPAAHVPFAEGWRGAPPLGVHVLDEHTGRVKCVHPQEVTDGFSHDVTTAANPEHSPVSDELSEPERSPTYSDSEESPHSPLQVGDRAANAGPAWHPAEQHGQLQEWQRQASRTTRASRRGESLRLSDRSREGGGGFPNQGRPGRQRVSHHVGIMGAAMGVARLKGGRGAAGVGDSSGSRSGSMGSSLTRRAHNSIGGHGRWQKESGRRYSLHPAVEEITEILRPMDAHDYGANGNCLPRFQWTTPISPEGGRSSRGASRGDIRAAEVSRIAALRTKPSSKPASAEAGASRQASKPKGEPSAHPGLGAVPTTTEASQVAGSSSHSQAIAAGGIVEVPLQRVPSSTIMVAAGLAASAARTASVEAGGTGGGAEVGGSATAVGRQDSTAMSAARQESSMGEGRKTDRDLRSEMKRMKQLLLTSAQQAFGDEIWEECGIEAEHLERQRLARLMHDGFSSLVSARRTQAEADEPEEADDAGGGGKGQATGQNGEGSEALSPSTRRSLATHRTSTKPPKSPKGAKSRSPSRHGSPKKHGSSGSTSRHGSPR